MMLQPQETTPSVHFNFDYSNQKTNQLCTDKDYVPYEYSFSTVKQAESHNKNHAPDQLDCVFETPPSYMRSKICKNLLEVSNKPLPIQRGDERLQIQNVAVKLNTEQFFEEFDKNFVVNFGETQNKNQAGASFRKTFQSCPGAPTVKDSVSSKIDSHISEPLARRLSIEPPEPQNQQEIAIESPHLASKLSEQKQKMNNQNMDKENKVPNCASMKSKLNCEIRKRILLKNNERLSNEVHRRKSKRNNKIINQENLMIITTTNWDNLTDLPIHRKGMGQANSQPIKRCEKTLKKTESNVFTTRFMFKQTLRSTTLDSWRKKFTMQKGQYDLKHKNRPLNIFQKPFSLIR